MQIRLLPDEPIFPNPELADADGLVGVSTDLSAARLLEAYKRGIFPWFKELDWFFWFSPDPRMVLFAADLHIQKSMRPLLNRAVLKVTFDTHFERVISHCAKSKRTGQAGTWIAPEFIAAYTELHVQGIAHSVEVWQQNRLVGGLYGVSLGGAFFGESMFSTVPNASKFGFIKLVQWLRTQNIHLIDCQVYTPHLAQFGAKEIPRKTFIDALRRALSEKTLLGKWHYSAG